jgi:hypothetical protein
LVRYGFVLMVALLLGACSRGQQQAAVQEATAAAATTAVTPAPTLAPTRTPTPAPSPTPTATPTPEPPRPAVVVADQAVGDDGRLVIERIVATEDAWLAVHAVANGEPGPVLAYTAVDEGEHHDLVLTLDPLEATTELLVALYPQTTDLGAPHPSAALAAATFTVELAIIWPSLIVADQEVTPDGVVHIDAATVPAPAWLLLHADDNGRPGPLLGLRPLAAGEHEKLLLAIDWRQATPRLHASLHHDHGRSGTFYEEVDTPLLVRGEAVAVTFAVTLPPDIFVLDQPAFDGVVEIERVISNGPGWLAVWFDIDGRPGRIIGRAPLQDGLNTHVRVPINPNAVTSFLFVTLHQDDDPVGEFNYPEADAVVTYQGEPAPAVSFRIDSGNYLVARDQPLGEEHSVTVPYAVVNRDAWLVIRAQENGEPGAILGVTWLPAGINRDVLVELDSSWQTSGEAVLFAVLHQDDGETQQFEYPEGVDTPLTRNQRVVMAAFNVYAR